MNPLNKRNLIHIVLTVVVLAAMTVTASAAVSPKPTGKLSSRLNLLAQVKGTTLTAQGAAGLTGLPDSGAGALSLDNQGRVLTYIFLKDYNQAALTAVEATGVKIVHASERYGVVTAYASPLALTSLNSIDQVRSVTEALRPIIGGRTDAASKTELTAAVTGCAGSTTSEGDAMHKADQARAAYGVDGTGVKVGVLSDSFGQVTDPTSAEDDVRSGDLPGPGNPCGRTTAVQVLKDAQGEGLNDEGRGMLQIVHDLAPGAALAFATAWDGQFDFAEQIRALRYVAGADVIVDDVSYFASPFFQDGPIAQAVEDVSADGAVYFSSAGNANITDSEGRPVGSFEAPAYRPCDCPNIYDGQTGELIQLTGDCHDFDPGAGVDPTGGYTIKPRGYLRAVLNWAEPWYGVETDMDIYIVDSNGVLVAYSVTNNIGDISAPYPGEYAYVRNSGEEETTYRLIINRFAGSAAPRIKCLTSMSGLAGTEYSSANSTDLFGPTSFGQSTAASCFSTAAAYWEEPQTPEYYSSAGYPVMYFHPVESRYPAAALPAPETRAKPEATAADGVATTFFGRYDDASEVYRFYGTSAAAPHAAAVAALLKHRANQLGVGLSPTLARSILIRTASPMSNGTAKTTGAGLINALAAAAELNPGGATVLFIKRMYRLALFREADSGGLAMWSGKLAKNRATGADLARALMLSPEMGSLELSDSDFISTLSKALWVGSPSGDEYQSFIDGLAGGMSRAELVETFIADDRFAAMCAEYGVTAR